ncbi:DUF2797 domain-containing protein [Agitococcus lubricus]|uniref:Uncharacterized protein DUF2797 n=1 Tax=Agitococcus lubricus TaxID=1077255 RepID=A0A2T5IZY7_9GAMM|nr:DUF2797 domain-containing protein [Agitococcus lubricus]PTQ89559.1 uncharacterized protein DUF2797 [Agitococcus lubricus]
MIYQGILQKMRTQATTPIHYELALGGMTLPVNDYLGKTLYLQYTGRIFCLHCGQKTTKSFNQGYCFKCFRSSASADMCIMKPETCHYHLGTCREPEWGQNHCFKPHIVYLANSSGVKVGITRRTQVPTRWLDQGAAQALAIFEVASRRVAGLLEVMFAQHVADKTHWQRLLKADAEVQDLVQIRDELLAQCADELSQLEQQFPEQFALLTPDVQSFLFPVMQYPSKVKAFNLDTQAEITGQLMGIKGQYLIFDTGVINIRKFGGYEVIIRQESV